MRQVVQASHAVGTKNVSALKWLFFNQTARVGDASSTTTSGISGVAGDTAKRTGDAEQGIKPIFDKEAIQKDIAAQVQITTLFGQQAAKSIGDYAGNKEKEAKANKDKAKNSPDGKYEGKTEAEWAQVEANWKEGGNARAGLHAVSGLLSGGVAGMLGAFAISKSADEMDALQDAIMKHLGQELVNAGADVNFAQGLAQTLSTILTQAAASGAELPTIAGAAAMSATLAKELKLALESANANAVNQVIAKTLKLGEEVKAARGTEAARGVNDLLSLNSPNLRHYADKVNQGSVAKEVNTVIDRSVVDVSADVAAIQSGQAHKIGDTFIINGRTYGVHDGTLFPISGPGLYTLDRGAYKTLGVLNKFGDTAQADQILKNMGVSPETKAIALRVFREIRR
jgi:hypothetical protein